MIKCGRASGGIFIFGNLGINFGRHFGSEIALKHALFRGVFRRPFGSLLDGFWDNFGLSLEVPVAVMVENNKFAGIYPIPNCGLVYFW